MSDTVPTLLLRNLHDVFGEIDPVRRRAAINEIFHEDAVFYDPNNGVYRGRDEIDRNISRSLRLRRWAMVVASDGCRAALASHQFMPELTS
jgi:hypothetical protein